MSITSSIATSTLILLGSKAEPCRPLSYKQYIWDSRPLDVHRWSDHPNAKGLIDQLWSEFTYMFPNYLSSPSKPGPKAKASNKKNFKVLILDLYVCWSESPTQWLGVHMSPKDYERVNSRYNALFISTIIIDMIKDMETKGWIEKEPGVTNPNGQGYVSRIRVTETLIRRFIATSLKKNDCPVHPDKEVIILTKRDPDLENGKLKKAPRIQYEDTPETIKMRTELKAYNALLASTQIDLGPDSPEYLVQTNKKGKEVRIKIADSRKTVERIFSRGSFEFHGRFYGGFWQRLNEENRRLIHIDGKPTVEVDFKALHVKLAYAITNRFSVYENDPYIIEWPQSLNHIPEYTRRGIVKSLILFGINAKSLNSAYRSFRQDCKNGSLEKRLTDKQLLLIIDSFLRYHPFMKHCLGADMGISLMNYDGKITAEIMHLLTKLNVPVLTIHDSYIVQREQFTNLRSAMAMAAIRIAGRDLHAVQDDIIANRCWGYNTYLVTEAS